MSKPFVKGGRPKMDKKLATAAPAVRKARSPADEALFRDRATRPTTTTTKRAGNLDRKSCTYCTKEEFRRIYMQISVFLTLIRTMLKTHYYTDTHGKPRLMAGISPPSFVSSPLFRLLCNLANFPLFSASASQQRQEDAFSRSLAHQ